MPLWSRKLRTPAFLLIIAVLAITFSAVPAAGASAQMGCRSTPTPTLTDYVKPFLSSIYTDRTHYMWRTNPFVCSGEVTGHTGDDWDLEGDWTTNYYAYAVNEGTVVASSSDDDSSIPGRGCFGRYMRLKTAGHQVFTSYAHMNWRRFDTGDEVLKGQMIGTAGSSGYCPHGAIHTHITMTKNWEGWYDIDTLAFDAHHFLKASGVSWYTREDLAHYNPNQ